MKNYSKYSRTLCLFLGGLIALASYKTPDPDNYSIENSKEEQKASENDHQNSNLKIKIQPAVTTISQINIIQELQLVLDIEIPDKESFTISDGEIRVDALLKILFRRIISINAP